MSSGGASLLPKIALITGVDVFAMINIADKKKTSAPINIQNSRELVVSSLCKEGIRLKLIKNRISVGTVKTNRKVRIKLNIGLPDSAKACTEVSPKIPVLVKKVE